MGVGDEGSSEVLHVPTARPAMLALAAVVVVSFALVGGTVIVTRETTQQTALLVENSLRSVRLVGEIRDTVTRMEVASPDELPQLERRLEQELVVYRPLAVLRDEADVLARFEELLQYILDQQLLPRERAVRFDWIHDTLARLVRINTRAAARTVARIEGAHRTALAIQIGAALLTLAAIGVIATVLRRVMRRQRVTRGGRDRVAV